APNVFHRQFQATEPNTKWATDITYIPTGAGWLSLAGILDLSSRIVVGWSMSSHGDEELVERALDMALARRRPLPGLRHPSDRGCQSSSRAYQRRLEEAGMIVSMSRKGHGWENAVGESVFGTLKEECVGDAISASHEEARLTLFSSLEISSNRTQRHSTLGYVSPFFSERVLRSLLETTSSGRKETNEAHLPNLHILVLVLALLPPQQKCLL